MSDAFSNGNAAEGGSMLEQRFAESVSLLQSARDKHGNLLTMHTLMVSAAHKTLRYDFDSDADLVDLRSVSKVGTCLALGALMDRRVPIAGRPLTPELAVMDCLGELAELNGVSIDPRWYKVQLKHLLSNSIGHEEGFLFRKDIGERNMYTLIQYVFSRPIEHDPGTHFSYSNVGPFLASAIIQLHTGRRLSDWADELLFGPLEFGEHSWKQFGEYDAGCTGLCVSPSDLHKLGKLVRDDGDYLGKEVISSEWVNRMHAPFVESPDKFEPHRALPKFAYGFGLWVCQSGDYYCDGTDGQYLIVLPASGIVISTTGAQSDMKPITECFRNFIYA